MPSRLVGAASAPRQHGSGLQPGSTSAPASASAPSSHRHSRQQHHHQQQPQQQPAPAEMPPYEPLAFPYSDKAKDDIAQLYTHLKPGLRYRQEASSSRQHVQDIVGPLNDVLFERRTKLAQLTLRKDQETDADRKRELEASIGQASSDLANLELEIRNVNIELEAAARQGIDHEARLDDEMRAIELASKCAIAQTPPPDRPPRRKKQKPRRTSDPGTEDEQHDEHQAGTDEDVQEEPVAPMRGILEFLEETRKAAEDDYASMTMAERYATANSYVGFKRSMHDALFRDGKPMPHASDWFDDHGPVIGFDEAQAGGDSDDDIAIEGEVISTKCPLSMAVMKEPYKSDVCGHIFDKASVTEFLRANGGHANCPVGGCDKILHSGDFTLDPIMLRRIERERLEMERQRRDGGDDEDGSGDD